MSYQTIIKTTLRGVARNSARRSVKNTSAASSFFGAQKNKSAPQQTSSALVVVANSAGTKSVISSTNDTARSRTTILSDVLRRLGDNNKPFFLYSWDDDGG
eukprot:TRINITY_DN6698_c0_g1_i1.p2 TRINITY_DN6698_c0_g1~~TRINITY_DN6698_c0_g1_i1.p2  ORF type:complete len:101 (-),score=25.63 TRINITY_DN6698_c0_g1_i1:121-423(-)